MTCPVCGGADSRVRRRLPSTTLRTCARCGLTWCSPFAEVASASSGQGSVLTEEAFTERTIQEVSGLAGSYAALADRRLQLYAESLGRPPARLLEIGCGPAGLAERMLARGVDYHGLDLDPRMIEAGRQRGLPSLEVADFLAWSPPGRFDVVFLSQVLEHIKDPPAFLDRVAEVLVPGGLVHVDVPNHRSLSGVLHAALPLRADRFGGVELPHHQLSYRARTLEVALAPRFDARVFTATPDDPVWGQPHASRTLASRAYHRASAALRLRSLVVGFGPRKGESA